MAVPSPANARARARPMPLAAPVSSATFGGHRRGPVSPLFFMQFCEQIRCHVRVPSRHVIALLFDEIWQRKVLILMNAKCNLITGASGLLGSHIAQQLVERGEQVVALVRPTSDIGFLQGLGVEIRVCDLRNPASLQQAFTGAGIVYHCAAKVGDWGPWPEFQAQTIDATKHVVHACQATGVDRLLYVSAISVYGIIKDRSRPVTESDPLGQHLPWWDYYARAKIQAEEQARQFERCTVIRPPWFFGNRDRATIARVVQALRGHRVRLIGRGDNSLSI